MVRPNKERYLVSLAQELISQATRVRDLIGDVHWLSDGHHKESLLRGLLRNHLPSGVLCSRGFVIQSNGSEVSTEQDVLLVDATVEGPVFSSDDLIIVFPENVIAAISVKTTLDRRTITDSVAGLKSVKDIAVDTGAYDRIWCGAYFFDNDVTLANRDTLARAIKDAITANTIRRPIVGDEVSQASAVDMFCSTKSVAFLIDYERPTAEEPGSSRRLRSFECSELSTALFIAAVLDHVALVRGAPHVNLINLLDQANIRLVGHENEFF